MGRSGARGRGRVQAVLPRGMTRVLVVDDEPGLRQSLGLLLTDAGFEVAAESDGRRALERATQEPFDIILCDVRMPQLDGLEFLRAYQKRDGGALVIMMSAYGGEEAALAAMKEGAYDYIPKPFRSDEVVLTLRKAEERERLGNTIATLRAQLGASPESRAVVAESAAMQAALDIVGRVAAHKSTVLITGESGTGKEVIAQAIHRASPRAAQLLVAINCAAIPEALLESELFGHVRGAFTGATADKAGLFEQADKGTLFLDEIGELPLGLQAKLLRVLQDGEVRRVGDQRVRRVDVRVLAATAKDLTGEVAAGRAKLEESLRVFRELGEGVGVALCSLMLGVTLPKGMLAELGENPLTMWWRLSLGRDAPLATNLVAWRTAVSHILSGITIETSRRTPDHRTWLFRACAARLCRRATSAFSWAKGWRLEICPWRLWFSAS